MLCALALIGSIALAQDESAGFDAQLFSPTMPGEPLWRASRGSADPSRSWGLRAVGHYALDPLMRREGRELTRVVGSVWQLDLQGAGTIGRLRGGLTLPVLQAGQSEVFARGFGLGDLRLDGRLTMLDASPIGLGVVGELVLPTRTVDDALGSGSVAGTLGLAGDGEVGRLTAVAEVGLLFGKNATVGQLSVGEALVADLGASWRVDPLRTVSLEVGTRAWLGSLTRQYGVPVEVLLGGTQALGRRYAARAGIGTSIGAGAGSPKLRMVLSIERRPVDPDPDDDGLTMRSDVCPWEAETFNGVRDADGCPEAVEVVEVLDPKVGTPVPEPVVWADSDGDERYDPVDLCPQEPEDEDGFEDDDGCPEPDDDEDQVVDAIDRCPREAETANGFEDEDGCPDLPPPEVLEFATGIEFETASDVLRAESIPILEEVLAVASRAPDRYLLIEGHTDAQGTPEFNEELSRKRAERIRSWLVDHGVDDDRLHTRAFGEDRPIDSNDTADGRARNRRVVITLISEGEELP